jgi:hypothetical protein
VFEQVQRAEVAPVAVVGSAAQAQLLATTLGVEGIDAHVITAAAYPSLDWVEGVAITVALDQHAEAATILAELGHGPLPPTT